MSDEKHHDAPHSAQPAAGGRIGIKQRLSHALKIERVDGLRAALVGVARRDDVSVAVACIVTLLVLWYWSEASVRRTERELASTMALCDTKLASLEAELAQFKERWEAEVVSREKKIASLMEENAQQTRKVDQLSSMLRQCAPPPPAQ